MSRAMVCQSRPHGPPRAALPHAHYLPLQHFCGLAQMKSAVDFDTKHSVWAAEGVYSGSFDIEWIYVKVCFPSATNGVLAGDGGRGARVAVAKCDTPRD